MAPCAVHDRVRRETNSITEEAAARREAAKASIERGGGSVTADRAHVVVARLGAVTAISAVRALEASGRRGTVELVDVVADVAGDLHAVPKDARPPGSKITGAAERRLRLPHGGGGMRSGAGAAGAAGAAAAGGDAGGEAPQQNGSQQNGGPDLSAFAEQLGQMSESQEQMRAFLQTAPWAQQQETGESTGTDGVDLSFLDADDDELAGYDDDGDDEATQETIEALANATEGFVENSIAPLAERLDAMQRQAEWRQVAEEFPDLEDREVQRDVFEAAQALGDSQGWPVEIWSSPQMVKTVYLAQQAVRIAQEEGEDGEVPAAHLEGGAGAGAGGGGPTDEITQMLGAKSGRHTSLPVR